MEAFPATSDAAVLDTALERYRAALFAVALDRLGRPDVAEEMAQEAITLAWEHRAELRDPQALPSWLFRIAVNCCLQWQRREDRWARCMAAENAATGEPVLEEILRRETVRELRSALADAPVKNRIAFVMHVHGYSYEEMGRFLEVPASTVRGRLARTRERLRRSLISRLRASLGREGDETI